MKREMFSAISGKFLNLSQSYELLLIVFFSTGNSEVNWWASEWENVSDWEQETEADENQTDEGKQTTGKTKQADTAGEADDGAETQEAHGTARSVSVWRHWICLSLAPIQ